MAVLEEGVDVGLRLRLLPMVRLVPVSVMGFEDRFSGVLNDSEDVEEDRSVSRFIATEYVWHVLIISHLYSVEASGTESKV